MKYSLPKNASPDFLLDLTRQYQATKNNDKRGRLLEEILSHFARYMYSRKMKLAHIEFDDFIQYVMIKFWQSDYIGKYNFGNVAIKPYIMMRINFCGLHMYSIERKSKNKFNNETISIYDRTQTDDGQTAELADILPDFSQNTEKIALDELEYQGRIEFLKSVRKTLLSPCRIRALDALVQNPASRLIEVARAAGCSSENARQLFLQVGEMAAMHATR